MYIIFITNLFQDYDERLRQVGIYKFRYLLYYEKIYIQQYRFNIPYIIWITHIVKYFEKFSYTYEILFESAI